MKNKPLFGFSATCSKGVKRFFEKVIGKLTVQEFKSEYEIRYNESHIDIIVENHPTSN